jgi:hypothetical protein
VHHCTYFPELHEKLQTGSKNLLRCFIRNYFQFFPVPESNALPYSDVDGSEYHVYILHPGKEMGRFCSGLPLPVIVLLPDILSRSKHCAG